ncbi:MAG: tRNA pseudouridine(55) synthase TruB [Pirellula sp.]
MSPPLQKLWLQFPIVSLRQKYRISAKSSQSPVLVVTSLTVYLSMLGVLNLHKPCGPTSRDCVAKIENCTFPFKVGHAGTLDPMASGILLLLIGPAVRLMDDFHLLDKEYVATFELGVTSPSADMETNVQLVENAPQIQSDAFCKASEAFVGTISQTPPVFSAVRIGGRRAHNLARLGKRVEMPSREVEISSIEVLSFHFPHVSLRVVCGTGTYIRSIGRDIARSLGSDAVMTSLIRTRIGPFGLVDSIALDSLTSRETIQSAIRPAQQGLCFLPQVRLENGLLERFRFGQHIELESGMHSELVPHRRFIATDSTGKFHGIIEFDYAHDVWKAEKYLMQPSYLQQLEASSQPTGSVAL